MERWSWFGAFYLRLLRTLATLSSMLQAPNEIQSATEVNMAVFSL
jgi:hypothetical protein